MQGGIASAEAKPLPCGAEIAVKKKPRLTAGHHPASDGVLSCHQALAGGIILFPNENAPRCAANFFVLANGVKCSVAALR